MNEEAIEWLRSRDGQAWSRGRIREARRANHSAAPSFHMHQAAHSDADVIAIGLFTIEACPSSGGQDLHRRAIWVAA